MANVFVEENSLQDIADAIRKSNGGDEKYLPSEMASAIQKLDMLKHVVTARGLFANVVFPEDMLDITVNLLNLKSSEANNMNATFSNSNVRSVRIFIPSGVVVNSWGLFLSSKNIEYVEFINGFTTNNVANMFNSAMNIKKIIGEMDVSQCTTLANMFPGISLLEEVYFVPFTIKYDLHLANAKLLKDESVKSIISGLADLTGQTAQILTLHADVKAKLTDEQVATITDKNWTLA